MVSPVWLVGLAFDLSVSTEEERMIVSPMKHNEGSAQSLKRIEPCHDPASKCMHNLGQLFGGISMRMRRVKTLPSPLKSSTIQ